MSDAHYILEIAPIDGVAERRTIRADRTVIGRREGDIVIDDKGASGTHAEIAFDGETITVRDLGSTNGTVHEGSLTHGTFTLRQGGTFQIGRTKFNILSVVVPEPEPEVAATMALDPVEEPAGEAEATAFMSADDGMMDDGMSGAAAGGWDEPAEPQAPAADSWDSGSADEEEEAEKTAWLQAEPEDDSVATQDVSEFAAEAAAATAAPADDALPDWANQARQEPEMAPPQAAAAPQGDGVRPHFRGTGGEIFKVFFLGGLLCMVTFGIYAPWFMCKAQQYFASRTAIGPTRHGWIHLRFNGTGGQLFVKALVGYLLTLLTLGIYGAWFACDMIRFFTEHTEGHADDGTVYQARFTMTGGQLFKHGFIGALLCIVTFYIYMPWFICKMQSLIKGSVLLYENQQQVGGFQFVGQGGQLFVTVLVGGLLTSLTFGIYGAWFGVNMMRFFEGNTRVYAHGRLFQGGFTGTGGDYFILNLVGYLLTMVTLGIYGFWYYAKKRTFQTNNVIYYEIPAH